MGLEPISGASPLISKRILFSIEAELQACIWGKAAELDCAYASISDRSRGLLLSNWGKAYMQTLHSFAALGKIRQPSAALCIILTSLRREGGSLDFSSSPAKTFGDSRIWQLTFLSCTTDQQHHCPSCWGGAKAVQPKRSPLTNSRLATGNQGGLVGSARGHGLSLLFSPLFFQIKFLVLKTAWMEPKVPGQFKMNLTAGGRLISDRAPACL